MGSGDGARSEFALIKTYGDEPHSYTRRLTKPVEGTVRVSLDGVEAAVSVDHSRGVIQFQTPPDEGVIITANFEFDVPVRFASDALDIVLDDFGATDIQEIPLIEIFQHQEAADA